PPPAGAGLREPREEGENERPAVGSGADDRVPPRSRRKGEVREGQRRAARGDALERDHASSVVASPGIRLRTTMSDAATTATRPAAPRAACARAGPAVSTPERIAWSADGIDVSSRQPRGSRSLVHGASASGSTSTVRSHRYPPGRERPPSVAIATGPSVRAKASAKTMAAALARATAKAWTVATAVAASPATRVPPATAIASTTTRPPTRPAAQAAGPMPRALASATTPSSRSLRRARSAPPTARVVPAPHANACDAIAGSDSRPVVPRIEAAAARAPRAPSAARPRLARTMAPRAVSQTPRGRTPGRRAPRACVSAPASAAACAGVAGASMGATRPYGGAMRQRTWQDPSAQFALMTSLLSPILPWRRRVPHLASVAYVAILAISPDRGLGARAWFGAAVGGALAIVSAGRSTSVGRAAGWGLAIVVISLGAQRSSPGLEACRAAGVFASAAAASWAIARIGTQGGLVGSARAPSPVAGVVLLAVAWWFAIGARLGPNRSAVAWMVENPEGWEWAAIAVTTAVLFAWTEWTVRARRLELGVIERAMAMRALLWALLIAVTLIGITGRAEANGVASLALALGGALVTAAALHPDAVAVGRVARRIVVLALVGGGAAFLGASIAAGGFAGDVWFVTLLTGAAALAIGS